MVHMIPQFQPPSRALAAVKSVGLVQPPGGLVGKLASGSPQRSGTCAPGTCIMCFRQCFYVASDGKSYCDGCWQKARKAKAAMSFPKGVAIAEDSDEEQLMLCRECSLPLGEVVYRDRRGFPALHGECLAEHMLQGVQQSTEARDRASASTKMAHREAYGIGWKARCVPRNALAAGRLGGGSSAGGGLCCVALDEGGRGLRLADAAEPSACVNLEYLSIALQVRRQAGREPLFSLDPSPQNAWMQVKRFEPEWLIGTSVGDVLFQADYYLKELSMGEYDQPVIGMTSCFDFSDAETESSKTWSAREWFLVKKAEVYLSSDGVLVPYVEMGVEAREQLENGGSFEDAPLTRPDHPLVKYAEQFTRNFDLIAERRSVVYHLRELAKASVLAKFILEAGIDLEESWYDLPDWSAVKEAVISGCCPEVPQLWKDRSHSKIRVQDGAIMSEAEGSRTHSVYGGVQFGLDRVRIARGRLDGTIAANALSALVPSSQLGFHAVAPREMASASMATTIGSISGSLRAAQTQVAMVSSAVGGAVIEAPPKVQAAAAAPAAGAPAAGGVAFRSTASPAMLAGSLRGVDLNLDKFDLNAPKHLDLQVPQASLTGSKFWALLDGEHANPEQCLNLELLRQIFNPSLSDRRSEGERFVGMPLAAPGYMERLSKLIRDEEHVREDRIEHFLSKDFVVGEAGPLFPPSWTSSIKIAAWRAPSQFSESLYNDEVDLEEVQSTSPMFDQSTEDGLRFRIYRHGHLEVRTTQEISGKELVGKVMSNSMASKGSIWGCEQIAKVTQFVFADACEEGQGRRYFALLETQNGSVIMTERLCGGSALWSEHAEDVEARLARAKLIGSVDCRNSGLTVQDVRTYAAAHRSERPVSNTVCKRYTQGLYNWARREANCISWAFQGWGANKVEAHSAMAAAPRTARPEAAAEPFALTAEEDASCKRRLASLFQASRLLRADPDVALAAIEQDGLCLRYAPEELRAQVDVVRAAVQQHGGALEFVAEHLRADAEVVLAAVEQDGCTLQFAAPQLQDEVGIVMAAVQQTAAALEFASERLRADRAVAAAAAQMNSSVMQHIPEGVLFDRELILSSLPASTLALEYATSQMLADPMFMQAAVEQRGLAIERAAPELRADRDFMVAVVRRNAFLLRFASEELRADRDVVLAALSQDVRSAKYADRRVISGAGTDEADEKAEAIQKALDGECAQKPLAPCPRGHVLQHFAAASGGCACDFCEERITPGQPFWSCPACCYDVCLECSERREASQADKESDTEFYPQSTWSSESLPQTVLTSGSNDGHLVLVGSWDGWRIPIHFDGEDRARVKVCQGVAGAAKFQVLEARHWWNLGAEDQLPRTGKQASQHALWEVRLPTGADVLEVTLVGRKTDNLQWRLFGTSGPELSSGSLSRCHARWCPPGPFYLAGSWDGWKDFVRLEPLAPDSPACCGQISVDFAPVPQAVEFQVVLDRSWGRRFGPSPDGIAMLDPQEQHAASWKVWMPARTSTLHVMWDPRGSRHLEYKLSGPLGGVPEVLRPTSGPRFSLVGSWDSWKGFADFMPAGPRSFQAHVRVRAAPVAVEFQVLQDQNWQRRYCPCERDGGEIIGPTAAHGRNFRAKVPRGCQWLRVIWYPFGKHHRVDWAYLGASGAKVQPRS